MISQQNHEMELETVHPSGVEEWNCPTCGRRFLLGYPPEYKRTILDAGDETAIHSGGKGGLSVGQIRVTDVEDPTLPEAIRASLEKILKGFDKS